MSDNYSLIIKNGSCFINGKLEKIDIALSGNKIKKIGKIELNSSKVFDATDKLVLPGIIDTQGHRALSAEVLFQKLRFFYASLENQLLL